MRLKSIKQFEKRLMLKNRELGGKKNEVNRIVRRT
jgi:ubiquitin